MVQDVREPETNQAARHKRLAILAAEVPAAQEALAHLRGQHDWVDPGPPRR
jgi:hypothetical protein